MIMEKNNLLQIDESQWAIIYRKIKHESTYKFMYSDIDNYIEKINTMIGYNYRNQANILRKTEHSRLVYDIKTNFMRVVSDINMLDLPNVAMCMQYVIEKLIDCIKDIFNAYANCTSSIRDLQSINNNKKIQTNICTECQNYISKKNIQILMNNMTIGDCKPTSRQIKSMNNQIQELTSTYQDIELSIMINQILQHKQNILNQKKNKVNTIYDQIAQYLESIPQSVVNLSKQNQQTDHFEINRLSNLSTQLQHILNQIIQKPIRKLIKKVLQYAKKAYKPGKTQQNGIQTIYSQSQQNIRALEKEKMNLKSQVQRVRQMKRQSEKQMIGMIDQQKKIQIKYSQLYSKHSCLVIDYQNSKKQLQTTKQKLKLLQSSKKQMNTKLIGSYSQQKTVLNKTIKDLKVSLEQMSNENKRLKKQNRDQMISLGLQTEFENLAVYTQTSQQLYQIRENKLNKSKKNSLIRFIPKQQNSDTYFQSQHQKDNDFVIQKKQNEEQSVHSDEQVSNDIKIQINHSDQPNNLINNNRRFSNKSVRSNRNYQINKKQSVRLRNDQDRDIKGRQKILSRIYGEQQFLSTNNSHKKKQYTGISIKGFNKNMNVQKQDSCISSLDLNQDQNYYNQTNHHNIHPLNFISQRHQKQHMSIPCFLKSHSNFFSIQTKRAVEDFEKDIMSEKKAKLLKKICENYELLQNKGFIKQAIDLIEKSGLNLILKPENSIKQYKNDLKKPMKKLTIQHKQIKSCFEQGENNNTNTKLFIGQKNTEKQFKLRDKRHQKFRFFNVSRRPQNGPQISQYTFSSDQIITLFISQKYLNDYEKSADIWGVLKGTISLDYQNKRTSRQILIFLLRLQKQNVKVYQQFCRLLNEPSEYLNMVLKKGDIGKVLESKIIKKTSKTKTIGEKTSNEAHENNPEQILNIFQKIIQFHKIIHKKCNHVVQFLQKFGFSSK